MLVLAGLILGVAVGLLLGLNLAWRRREVENLAATLEQERLSTERELLRARRSGEDLEARARDHQELIQLLPDLVGQMFASNGARGVYPVALKLVTQIFNPTQAAIFVARPGRLALAAGHGLPEGLGPGVGPGLDLNRREGRLAQVAAGRVTMTDADFRELRGEFAKGGPKGGFGPEDSGVRGLRVDVAAPIEGEQAVLLGVLSVGGVKSRLGEEKRLLTMVARLTAVAITHVKRLRTVEELVNVDGLTGVYNKRYFQKRIADEVQRADAGAPLSLLLLDIDYFKHYNDTNGHLEGDDVLRKVGQLLKGSGREDDIVARYGGEEFVVLYPGTGKEDAVRLAEELREAVAAYAFPHGALQPSGALTISGGVSTVPDDAQSGLELVRSADQALYDAKAAGRNRIVAARPNYLT
ncbi:MAG TPA: GGDEF domain-containing protein [Vicinamibacteria bacterium]|nr:GGDEF domain-containing protein [Vicinamibacteria bacterium]